MITMGTVKGLRARAEVILALVELGDDREAIDECDVLLHELEEVSSQATNDQLSRLVRIGEGVLQTKLALLEGGEDR